MSTIKNNVAFFERVSTFYQESLVEVLETKQKKIKEIFEELLKRDAAKYFLKSSNSIQEVFYFGLKGRVKHKDSFYEKLIRKDLGLYLIKNIEYEGDISSITGKQERISSLIYKIDDIIGLRIVTEIKEDCKSVYQLITDNLPFLEQKSIILSGLNSQPERMRNGLHIYKIKGTLDSTYAFELQIKSKIDEAWGDLDHSLFYKDYSVSPIKDTVQLTMNNVGFILEKLEKLLYDLRESSKKYDEIAEHIGFQTDINHKFGEQLLKSFKADLNLVEISDFILKIKDHFTLKGLGNGKNLSFKHLEYGCNNPLSQQFCRIRSINHKLLLIEAFYYHLKKVKSNSSILTEELYDENSIEFLDFLISYNLQGVSVTMDMKQTLTRTADFITNPNIYLSKDLWCQSTKILEIISSTLIDREINEENVAAIQDLLFVSFYNGDIESSIYNILKNIDLEDIKSSLNIINDEHSSDPSISNIMTPIYECLATNFQPEI